MSMDINDARPSSLSHMVGQRGVVDQLRVALDAAFEDGKKMDDALLVGPPGTGKSQIAAILAQELAVKSCEVARPEHHLYGRPEWPAVVRTGWGNRLP